MRSMSSARSSRRGTVIKKASKPSSPGEPSSPGGEAGELMSHMPIFVTTPRLLWENMPSGYGPKLRIQQRINVCIHAPIREGLPCARIGHGALSGPDEVARGQHDLHAAMHHEVVSARHQGISSAHTKHPRTHTACLRKLSDVEWRSHAQPAPRSQALPSTEPQPMSGQSIQSLRPRRWI